VQILEFLRHPVDTPSQTVLFLTVKAQLLWFPGEGNVKKLVLSAVAVSAVVSVAAQPAAARTVTNTKDGKPNILVVMTDDQALTDLYAQTTTGVKAMPNLASLIASKGVTFDNAVDSFPLCCPSRATFITGQYSHNHGVGGNFWPYGWYGMRDRANTLPAWLKSSGYYTALVGKWLNGYGAGKPADKDLDGKSLKAGGEVPVGFDNWNGMVDVSAYDYFNFVINQNGKLKSWGDAAYAKALNDFAEIQVTAGNKKIGDVLNFANKFFKSPTDPTTYGTQVAKNYSPDVTAAVSDSIIKGQAKSKKPFFLWWSPASPHREDVDGGIRNGYRKNIHYAGTTATSKVEDRTKLVKDPRPAPRYANLVWDWTKITSKPSYNAAPIGKPLKQQLNLSESLTAPRSSGSTPLPTAAEFIESNYNGRLGSIKAVDDGIKKLVDTLKATKQLDNTLILFTSDNGWLQGEHRVPGDKYLPYEESIRVPFLMRGPGIPSGRKVNTLVSNISFTATILDAAKATAGRTQDGISLLPGAKGTATIPSYAIGLEANAPLFADASMPQQWDQPYRGVRTDRWKYVVWCQKNTPLEGRDIQTCMPTGDQELYDLQSDPYELTNLASDSSYASIKAGLAAKMTALSTCVGAACRISQ